MTSQGYVYAAVDDGLNDRWASLFTNRIGDGGGDHEHQLFSVIGLVTHCKAGARLLDIGCGLGRFIGVVRDQAGSVVGLEPDEVRFRSCLNEFRNDEKVEVLHTTSHQFRKTRPDARFDVILLSMVLQHVPTDVCDAVLSDLNALLADNGIGIVSTTHARDERFSYQSGEIAANQAEFDAYAHNSSAHAKGIPVRDFSRQSLGDAVGRAGLAIIDWGQFPYVRDEKIDWYAKEMKIAPAALKDFGVSQYAVVKRAAGS
jgi:2-polyprenyl-3-methyl-5-hydroxy-6-metoxy-1,4-benzoquinol methylase